MARYPHDELEDIFIHPPPPHQRICPCRDDHEIEVSRNVSFIPLRAPARRIVERRTTFADDCCRDCHHHHHPPVRLRRTPFQDCCRDCHHHVRRCSCDTAESLFQFPTTYVKETTTTIAADSTHHMLNGWFKRYMNDDGYLGEADLTKLVLSLAGSSNKRPIRKALKEADADGDNQLSFREFLQMWHQASSHEEDFLDSTGCQDIVDIVNEYDLDPNVSCDDCDTHSGKDDDHHEEEDLTKCNCGSREDITPSSHRPDGKTNGSAVDKTGELPLFSCNRLPACSPKNWRE